MTIKKIIKALITVHRFLGFALCLLFVIWCLSGFVMMYRGFPSVTVEDKIKITNLIDLGNFEYPKKIDEFIDLDSISSLKIQAINNKTVLTIETNTDTVFNLSLDSIYEKFHILKLMHYQLFKIIIQIPQ